MDKMIDAVAEAWASIDGKLEKYEQDRDTPGGMYDDGVPWGYYEGYQVEAKELVARIKKRGWALVTTDRLSRLEDLASPIGWGDA